MNGAFPVPQRPPRLLAFDTSTEAMSVALSCASGPLGWTGAGGALASLDLIPRIEAMLAEAGIGYRDLDAIAYGCGPGAFTGLRTACAVAQGLAFGAGLPVLAVDSLAIVAEDARMQRLSAAGLDKIDGMDESDIWVAMDARMDEVYAAAYRWEARGWEAGRWQTVTAPALYTLPALNAIWAVQVPTAVAGSALAAFGERLNSQGALALPQAKDRAAALLRVAQGLWADGAALPADRALPLYLRDKVALTTREREAVRAAKLQAAL
jgi:tRNA threonylcarbamoyladenosine biosynthesis protein TsaB